MSELEYKKLEKVKKLYQCLGIENKDRDIIESIIQRMEQLQEELPKKLSDDDLDSLRYIIATEKVDTPISSNGKFPDDLKKVFDSSDITKIRVEGIFLKEGAILEYNKIIEEKKNGSLDIRYLFQQPNRIGITKRKTFRNLKGHPSTYMKRDTSLPVPLNKVLKENEKKKMKEILEKYPKVKKQQLDPKSWNVEDTTFKRGRQELKKIDYLDKDGSYGDYLEITLLLDKEGGAEQYNRLIKQESNQLIKKKKNQNNAQSKGINVQSQEAKRLNDMEKGKLGPILPLGPSIGTPTGHNDFPSSSYRSPPPHARKTNHHTTPTNYPYSSTPYPPSNYP